MSQLPVAAQIGEPFAQSQSEELTAVALHAIARETVR